jgi:hypothetical protein
VARGAAEAEALNPGRATISAIGDVLGHPSTNANKLAPPHAEATDTIDSLAGGRFRALW